MSENPRQEIADNLKAAILAKDGDAAAAEIEKLCEIDPVAADRIVETVIVRGLHNLTGM